MFPEDLEAGEEFSVLGEEGTGDVPAFGVFVFGPSAGLGELSEGGRFEEGVPEGVVEGGGVPGVDVLGIWDPYGGGVVVSGGRG